MSKTSLTKKSTQPARGLPVIQRSIVEERLKKMFELPWMNNGQAAFEDLLQKLQTDRNLQISMFQVMAALSGSEQPQDRAELSAALAAFQARIQKIAMALRPHFPMQHISGYGGDTEVIQFESTLDVINPEAAEQGLNIRLQLRGQNVTHADDFSLLPYGVKMWVQSSQHPHFGSQLSSYYFIHMGWREGYMAFSWSNTSYSLPLELN